MQFELIKRYFQGKCSREEMEQVRKYLANSDNDREIELLFERLWKEPGKLDDLIGVDFEKNYYKILNRISNSSSDLSIEKSKVGTGRAGLIVPLRFIIRIAAVLFIPLLFINIFQFKRNSELAMDLNDVSYTELSIPYGSRMKTELPDGSMVWLNGGSTLKYPQRFSEDKRIVEFEGEGYFDIAEDEEAPFILKTQHIDIRVLGTQFNLNCYPEYNMVTTALVEGRVEIRNRNDPRNSEAVVLSPSDKFSFDLETNQKSVVKDDNISRYSSWINGTIIFDDDPLDQVFERLEMWHNVDIQFDEKELEEYYFTATFETETLLQVLELIKLALPIEYIEEDWEKNPDNSYRKKAFKVELINEYQNIQ